ncbi:membrane protein insertion efficiency factor YidD [Patescibacteria group bacterium]|nr:MAG: membrane protein insertion efficiency factor YidD [Patescibacteria group bacterium]
MRKIIISTINFYQKFLSLDTGVLSLKKGTTCVFYPTCSEYTKQAVSKYGATKGLFMGFRRILRCHPWQKNHIDPLK